MSPGSESEEAAALQRQTADDVDDGGTRVALPARGTSCTTCSERVGSASRATPDLERLSDDFGAASSTFLLHFGFFF